jgi:hypothetical protein|tara:strand:+ start:801 stop:1016 length:216 start_codon:yes stop_codon:yes gene_type:complete
MNYKSVIIALLIVFALGGYVNRGRIIDWTVNRTVNSFARFGLRWFIKKRFQEPAPEYKAVVPGEIDHSRSL